MPSLDWYAGIFEGEGSICIHGAGRRGYTILSVQIAMTDEQIVMSFAERWPQGHTRTTNRNPTKWRAAYWWVMRGRASADFLREIQPHVVSDRVREKITLALEFDLLSHQGSRDPDYKAKRLAYRGRMGALNTRGPVAQLERA